MIIQRAGHLDDLGDTRLAADGQSDMPAACSGTPDHATDDRPRHIRIKQPVFVPGVLWHGLGSEGLDTVLAAAHRQLDEPDG